MKKIFTFLISIIACGVVVAQDFTLMVLPDTQFYIVSYSTPSGGGQGLPIMFQHQIDFIKNNVSPLNIKFVTHVGDIVDHGQNQWEWDLANGYMSQLDGIVPYAIAPGNHDASVMWGHDYPLYNATFPASRYQGKSWYGGSYPAGNNKNNYELFSTSGMDFIIIHLESDPPVDARTWASGILDQYPNRRAIITTHWYLEGGLSPQGSAIWNEVINNHPNVFLQICGHSCAREGMLASVNKAGGTVYQILTDYQCDFNGGNGQLRYYTFHPAKNQIEGFTYSPETKLYGTHFTLDYQMTQPTTPQISGIAIQPTAPRSSDQVTVTSTISDIGTIVSAKLQWGTTTGNLTNEIPMTSKGNNIYTAALPAQPNGTSVYYKISATNDKALTTLSPEASYKVSDNLSSTFFDYETIDLSFTGFGGGGFTKITNPVKGGINLSNNVGQCIKAAASQTWAGVYSTQLSSKIDFSSNKIFKLKTYSPKICTVLLKLEDNANASITKEISVSTSTVNGWEELSFDFTGAPSAAYDKITLFFDFGNTSGNTYYFDDMKLTSNLITGNGNLDKTSASLNIFPNPTSNILYVENNNTIDEVIIFNYEGRLLERIENCTETMKINTSKLSKGIYFIEVKSNDDITFKRFIKE
jgi:hypothetical protein